MMQDRNRPRVYFPDTIHIFSSFGKLEYALYFRKQLDIILLDVLVACEIAYIVQNGLHSFYLFLRSESLGRFNHKIGFVLSLYYCNESFSKVTCSLLHLIVACFLLLQFNFLICH